MKLIKKYFLLTLLLTSSALLFSQQRGGSRNSSEQQGKQSQMTQPQMNPENMAGILMYDSDEIIKKMKVKDVTKQTLIIKAIAKHNNKINELKTFNYEIFTNTNKFLDKKRNEALLNLDNSMMREARLQANEMLLPISEKVQEQQAMLNTVFEKELSEKQYKTWIKYQQAELKKLKPKTPENSQMQGGGQRSQHKGQGMNAY